MKKKIIVAAIAAAVAAPLVAMADATVYGKIRVASQYHDRNNGVDDAWGLQDHTSRLGIKGSEDLGGGLKAVYKMEFGVNVGDGFGGKDNGFWNQRNSYVGLAGGWGSLLVGRHDTPYKMSSGKLDMFGDTAADYDVPASPKGVGLFDSLRLDGVIAYISPNMSGFTFAGAVVQTDVDPSIGFDKKDDFAGAYSVAGMYSNGPWFASLAYENQDAQSLAGLPSGFDDDKKWRVGVGILGWSGFSAAFIYEDHDNRDFNPLNDNTAWQLQAGYDFGNNRVKGMYGDYDDKKAGDVGDYDTWAIGLQHNFSKRTDVEVLYRALDRKKSLPDDNVFALQLNHAF